MNIKEKSLKTRKFIAAHQGELLITVATISAFAAGIAAKSFYDNNTSSNVHFIARKTTLKKLTDNGGAIVFNNYQGHDYALINYLE
jgi:hypothetical protein